MSLAVRRLSASIEGIAIFLLCRRCFAISSQTYLSILTMCFLHFYSGKAIPFITIEDGQFLVSDEAREFLSTVRLSPARRN
jgi:hypothetical protein